MKLRDFVDLYDNWNGILVVNDDNLKPIVKGKVEVALSYGNVYEKKWLPSASMTTNFV